MLEVKGKFNTAKIFTGNIDNETFSQIITLCNQEFTKDSKIRIMPDTHAGKGCVIGTTMTIHDKIVPNLVGVDIGCGMITIKLGRIDLDFQKLDDYIRQNIPHGFNIHERPQTDYHKIEELICSLSKSSEKFVRALGSLGGGNHFIEINISKVGEKYLVIHSGSRNLGHQVASYYQRKAIDYHASVWEKGKIPRDLTYLEGRLMQDYLHDMKIIQDYANVNREVMAKKIITECLQMDYNSLEKFQTIHNYIDTENMILRKGAISAQKGEKVLIPINMRDGSILAVGKGNPDWNCSAPHGAGRILSRGAAKKAISLEQFKETMKGIWSTSINKSTIDEAPMVYKPLEEIVKNIRKTVEIIEVIKPLYNFKAS